MSSSSSNCPPQLHLSLPTNATSFKRSFEQFGFDLESPVGQIDSATSSSSSSASSTSSTDRNDRNKRARSASSSSRSAHSDPSPSSSSSSDNQSLLMSNFTEPPRLPTPDLPDVDMTAYPHSSSHSPPLESAIDNREQLFRLSLDRFNAFDSQISILRDHTPHAVRSPSPPPTLPPLSLSSALDDSSRTIAPESPFRADPSDFPFPLPPRLQSSTRDASRPLPIPPRVAFNPHAEGRRLTSTGSRDRSSSSSSFSMFTTPQITGNTSSDDGWSLVRNPPSHPHSSASGPDVGTTRDNTSFRHRLDSALDLLRSQSPLFSDHIPDDSRLPRMHTQVDDRTPRWTDAHASFSAPFTSTAVAEQDDDDDGSPNFGPAMLPPITREPSISLTDHRRPNLFQGAGGSGGVFTTRETRTDPDSAFLDRLRRSSSSGHDSSTGTRGLNANLERARRIERETDALLTELRSIRDENDSMQNNMSTWGRNNATERSQPSPESNRFYDHNYRTGTSGADSRPENTPIPRTFLPRWTESRQFPRLTTPQFSTSRAVERDSTTTTDPEWLHRRSRILYVDMQGTTNPYYDNNGWRIGNADSNARETTTSSSPPHSQRPHDSNRLQWSPPMSDFANDTIEPGPSNRVRIPTTRAHLPSLSSSTSSSSSPPHRIRSHHIHETHTNPAVSADFTALRQRAARGQWLSRFLDDQSESPVFSSDDEDWTVLRPSNVNNHNHQGESSPFTRRPPPPPPPPRAQFSLPTPEFSPIFDPLSDREDLNHHHHHPQQTDLSSSSSRNRSRSSLTDLNPLRSSAATSDERDRRSHSNFSRPTSSPSHVVPPPHPPPPPENPSMYGNFDLNAYHDGPFRASLQRFIELDRVRSRSNRLDSNVAANDSATGPGTSLPPSLPPLRFDYDLLPFSASHSDSGPVSAPSQESPQSRPDFQHGVSRSMDARRSRVGPDAVDEILRERLRRRAPPPVFTSNSRDNWRAPPHTRTRPTDTDHRARRDTHVTFSSQRPELPRIESTSSPWRGQAAGFAHAIDVLRRDGLSGTSQRQFVERFQRETGQETTTTPRRTSSSSSANWGEIEGVSEGRILTFPDIRRRVGVRRSLDGPSRIDRSAAPVTESSSSVRHSNAGGSNMGIAGRRRPPSQSPSRDDGVGAHERLTMRSRFRAMRPRLHHHQDRDLIIEDLPSFEFNFGRRNRSFGDYMRDEDFDPSYESLVSLAAALGDAKPRAVPEHIIATLPAGFYKDWASTEGDKRCPICLDDYKPLDPVLKLWDCSHWLHKECLEQWLRGASTCPVCRKRVKEPGWYNRHGSSGDPGPSGSRGNDGSDGGSSGGRGVFSSPPPWRE